MSKKNFLFRAINYAAVTIYLGASLLDQPNILITIFVLLLIVMQTYLFREEVEEALKKNG